MGPAMSKEDDIKNHRRIKISEVNVLRRLDLSLEECQDETTLRRFCAENRQTLPDMIEIDVEPTEPGQEKYEKYAWHIVVWEQPNSVEDAPTA